MHLFYTPDIAETLTLPEVESGHCVRVLRLVEGDEIGLIDGRGTFYRAAIDLAHNKRCKVRILEERSQPAHWVGPIEIAIAPTKNLDRMEWFTEKTTEMGVDAIVPLLCRFSERKELKVERIEKIAISAMKQSLKAVLPCIDEMTPFERYVREPFDGQKFIAHCYADEERKLLSQTYKAGSSARILIGPEGDFSPEEVSLAIENSYVPISLGASRLRTETAGVVACHTLHTLNEVAGLE
ncbi:MAG: 16S rRNA (uracil(1498)-N(3))-methyltransferase [Bacteroidaceae bacterium]|nr:16S rRNA (uracil(1498)-N(3))-methyltransferase [Bacteroidaceae bacterium]MBR6749397.1 16S rRNA (uracil(1498)-N(3))-methyltransferase [Bacteroidaceae bacterium]